MPKRKRNQTHLKDKSPRPSKAARIVTTNASDQKRTCSRWKPTHTRPRRRSERLRTNLQQGTNKSLDPPPHLPTPALSHCRPDRHSAPKRRRLGSQTLASEGQQTKKRRLPEVQVEAKTVREDFYAPIKHWIKTDHWPANYADKCFTMNSRTDSSENSSKKLKRSSSYSQSVKEGTAPEQYTVDYERTIARKGLEMDIDKGENLVSERSKEYCVQVQEITRKAITPTIFPRTALSKVRRSCQNRNEAKVNRDITPMIVPPVLALDTLSDQDLEHITDEVNMNWNATYILYGPQIRPDLAVGLSDSLFSEMETFKLSTYASVDNWAKFTGDMYFPFFMCEVKCGREGLDQADRQNMHSSSVAVRAILRLEQEADKFRKKSQLKRLDEQILVFSISHDQQDARLYGHFGRVVDDQWTYYRYKIKKYDLTIDNELIAIHNAVRNILESHPAKHISRIKAALAALPEPTTLSFSVSDLDVSGRSESNSQGPARSSNTGFKKPSLSVAKLLEQMEQQRQQMEKQMEQQRFESKQREERLEKQMEQQRLQMEKQSEQQRLQMEKQSEEMIELLRALRKQQ